MSQMLDSLFRKNIVTLKDYKANRFMSQLQNKNDLKKYRIIKFLFWTYASPIYR